MYWPGGKPALLLRSTVELSVRHPEEVARWVYAAYSIGSVTWDAVPCVCGGSHVPIQPRPQASLPSLDSGIHDPGSSRYT